MINQEQFLGMIKASQREGYKLITKKNADYAGEKDPFKNFKLFEFLMRGVDLSKCDPTEIALLVRLTDKIQRIGNLLSKEPSVKDESFKDTLLDLANYSHILLAYREDKKNEWGFAKPNAEEKTTERDIDNK